MSRSKPQPAALRIEELAEATGATVRNIRVYQEKGLLPPPERRGRLAVYGPDHLRRLRIILRLLDRGYTFATIDELLTAERMGLSLTDLIEAKNPRAFRRGSGRRRMYTRDDAEALVGFGFSEAVLRVGAEGGIVRDPEGEEGFLTEAHLYALLGDLVASGMTANEIDAMSLRVFEGQQHAAKAIEIVLTAIRRRPEMEGATPQELLDSVLELIPRAGAAVRVIYQSVCARHVRNFLELSEG